MAKKVARKKVAKKPVAKKAAAKKKVAKKSAAAAKAPARTGQPMVLAGAGVNKNIPKAKNGAAGAWTLAKVMAALKALGSEQTRKTWARHGVTGEMFGVKFGDMYKIRKQIGIDHELAKQLWDTGNADARTLGALIADGNAFTAAELDRWAASVECYGLCLTVGDAVARCPYSVGQAAVDRWVGSPREYLSRCGWAALSSMLRDGIEIPGTKLRSYLRMIEERQATAPNRAREGMNLALIAIGAYADPVVSAEAIAAAKRIGPIRVDHGDTACRDFDPLVEIPKARAHREKMAAKKKAKAG